MAASDAFYQELLLEVNSIIDELGTSYSVRGITENSFDVDTLETTVGSSRSVDGLVATQDIKDNLAAQIFAITESSRNWAYKKALILKASSAPNINEEVLVDGVWFPLGAVEKIQPADIVLLYILDVSK